jgi:cytochrome c2
MVDRRSFPLAFWRSLGQGLGIHRMKRSIPVATFSAICAMLALDPCAAAEPKSMPLSDTTFLEKETPFLRSALVIGEAKQANRVRRGVIIPLGHDHWACFDPDLLRWAAIWRAETGQAPLSYDSMAAISYPDAKAKAEKPPMLRGKVVHETAEIMGVSLGKDPASDPRPHVLTDGKTRVGPLPVAMGRFHGIALRGSQVVVVYQIGDTSIEESLRADAQGNIQRALRIGAHNQSLRFALGSDRFQTRSSGAIIRGNVVEIAAATQPREYLLFTAAQEPKPALAIPAAAPATPVFPKALTLKNPTAKVVAPFALRDFGFPTTKRAIRPVDIAFFANGDAILSTLDGDIWKISGLDAAESTWRRIATGLYEPMAVAIDTKQRLFVLGRDQITELIDSNGDHHIDLFRCASDAFFQTLHTRDFSTSMAIEADGSFLIAKGGIDKEGGKGFIEQSTHRGAILRISPDGRSITSIAQGLRMPFVGLRQDGAVFASDQQGNEIPSTPIHRIFTGKPHLGFSPTNFDKIPRITEPLLYYPYQSNRSAAGFATTSAKAFPELGELFVQVSWNGRLFPILTPKSGQAFSWMLPLQLDFPSLKAATHPQSGRLYVTGIGISGYVPTTPQTMGLASIETAATFPAPVAVEVSQDAIVVQFHRALHADESLTPASLRLFDIQRTRSYGSGHILWNKKPGEHQFPPKSFALSADRRTLRIEYPLLRRSDVMDLQLNFTSPSHTFPLHLYSRPQHLPAADARDLQLVLEKSAAALTPGDATAGKAIFTRYACNGCHSLAGEKLTGPPLQDVATRHNAATLRQSILEPAATIAPGYPPSMPSFQGVIPAQDLEHLIAYLLTLKK